MSGSDENAGLFGESDVENLLAAQGDGSRISDFRKAQLERDARKNWDKFYLRNETNFFKDRHWTTREFKDLTAFDDGDQDSGGVTTKKRQRTLLEVGCGVGNFVFPLVEDGLEWFVYACDFSERAVGFVKSDQRYDATRMHAFVADVTKAEPFSCVEPVDVVSLIFVLSAIHPDKFSVALENVLRALKPGGVLLFRDYGLHDMAQLRFKAGNKLGENFYVRQDGTRSYYFTPELVKRLGEAAGFQVLDNEYVHRMTVNKKEGVEAKRVFVQARLRKPA